MALTQTGPSLALVTVSATLLILSWILVILRVIVRRRIRGFGLDDSLMCVGLVFFTLACMSTMLAAYNGVGIDKAYLNSYYDAQGRKWFMFFQLFYVLSTVPIKSSICFAMMRITNRPIYRWILYTVIILASIACITTDVAVLSVCRPIQATWDKSQGECADPSIITGVSYFISAVSILTDWTCAILPAFIMWNVHLRFRIKASVAVVLGLGVFASSATLVRLPYLLSYGDPSNYLLNIANIAIWSIVESGIGIIAGSLATLRPLLKYVSCMNPGDSSAESGRNGMSTKTKKDFTQSGHPMKPLRFDNGNGNQTTIQAGGGKRVDGEWQEISDDSDSQKFILENDRNGGGGAVVTSPKGINGNYRGHHNGPGITITRDVTQKTGDAKTRQMGSDDDDISF